MKKPLLKRTALLILAVIIAFTAFSSFIITSNASASLVIGLGLALLESVLTGYAIALGVEYGVALEAEFRHHWTMYNSAMIHTYIPKDQFQRNVLGYFIYPNPDYSGFQNNPELFQITQRICTAINSVKGEGNFKFEFQGSEYNCDYNTMMLLTEIGIEAGFTFDFDWSDTAIVNNVVGKEAGESNLTRTAEGYQYKAGQSSITLGDYSYYTTSDLVLTSSLIHNAAEDNVNWWQIDKSKTTRFVPYFIYMGDIYVNSNYTLTQITNGNSNLGIVPLIHGYGIWTANSYAYRLNLTGPGDGTVIEESFKLQLTINTDGSMNYDIPEEKIINSRYIGLPETFINIRTGEFLNWQDVINPSGQLADLTDVLNNALRFIIADKKLDGTTIDEVLAQPVTNPQEYQDNKDVFIPLPPITGLLNDFINKGLVSENPEVRINEKGEVTTVDGIDVKELERTLELEKTMPGVTEIPFSASDMPFFSHLFPFSLGSDFLNFIGILHNEDEMPPIFSYDFVIKNELLGIDINKKFVVNPTIFRNERDQDVVRMFLRYGIIVLFSIGLIRLTAKLALPSV